MTDKKISALTNASIPLAGTEVLPIVQGGATVKATVASLLNGANLTGSFAPLTANGVFTLAGAADGSTTYQLTKNAGTTLAITGSEYAAYGVNPLNIITYVYGDNAYSVAINNYRITKVTTTGHNVLIGDSTVTNGNFVPTTAAKGVNFTANTPAAGMTSQLLNWYEEGTWTPTQGSGLTVVGAFSSSGAYTRIGRQVIINGSVTASTSLSCVSGSAICAGLPFTVLGNGSIGSYSNGNFSVGGSVIAYITSIFAVGTISSTTTVTFTAVYFI